MNNNSRFHLLVRWQGDRLLAHAATKHSAMPLMRFLVCTLLCALALVSCATPPAPSPVIEPQHWSISRTVQSALGMVTLFDPLDLVHHEADPKDWYQYDFAFANDLETGRFAAVLTDQPGRVNVRLTTGPLSTDERQMAGPHAVMRLRVINYRLLLTGGDAWPSTAKSARSFAYDSRWIGMANGDYRVVITALDRQQGALHDVVIQLLPVDDMYSVAYAPGIPYLVVGEPAGVAGINAGGLTYRELCKDIPDTVAWSPLTSRTLPVPGSVATIHLAAELHEQGRAMQVASKRAAKPIVVARNTNPGSIGVFVRPDTWHDDSVVSNGEVPVTTRILCAVKIQEVIPDVNRFALQIEPLPGARDPLSNEQYRAISARFDNWIRQSNDPAWRFKSAQIQRTKGHRAMMLGIMEYLELNAKHTESLLQESNAVLAERLLEHMTNDSVDVTR